ncbi:MAG: hypothetical protein JKY53_13645 [Flavobacteriales bacterium]|nr:hypothetical protein [Flavobacteriales bacterium]
MSLITIFIVSCGESKVENKTEAEMPIVQSKYIHNSNATSWKKDWKTNNTVVFHIVGEPATLHPSNEPSTIAQFIFQYTQGFIVRSNLENLVLQSGVIKQLPSVSENKLTFIYALRDAVFWDDGTLLTLSDIEFTLKVNKCPIVENAQAKSYFENLKSISLNEQENTFSLTMKENYVQNVAFLSDYPILQKSFFDPNGFLDSCTLEDFDSQEYKATESISSWAAAFNSAQFGRETSNLNGLGAYRVDEWDAGNSIRLVKKQNHWTAKLTAPTIYETAYPDTIIFQLNNDPNSQYLEFKNQNFDGSGYLSSQTMTKLMADESFKENYHAAFLSTFNYSYAAMNMRPESAGRTPIFTDKKVRQAMAYLNPVNDMIDLLFEGQSTQRIGAVSSLKPTFNSELKSILVNIEKAKQLLADGGWTDTDNDGVLDKKINGKTIPLQFELLCMNNMSIWGDMAELMSETMKKAGVNAKLKLVDYSILYQKAAEHDFDMLLLAWGGSSLPDDHTQIWHTSSWLNNGSNFTGFGTTESDSLIELSKITLNETKRIEIEHQLQQLIYEEQPYLFLMNGTRKIVLHKRFDNANMYSEKPGGLLNNLELSKTIKQSVSLQP